MKNFFNLFFAFATLNCATILSNMAFAVPRFTLITGESCASCHVNPTGGGMRDYYGIHVMSRDTLPMWPNDNYDFSTNLTPNISIGADARAQILAADSLYDFSAGAAGKGGSAIQPMQASLYLYAGFTDKIGLYLKQDFVTSTGSFEYWGIARVLPNDGYIKFGAFQPAVGLRVDDHTSFTRNGDYTQNGEFWGMGLYPNSKDVGVEIGEYVSNFFALVSVTNGDFPSGTVGATGAFPNFTGDKTITGRLEYTNRFSDDFSLFAGASILKHASTQIAGGFAGARYGIVSLTADYENGKNLTLASGTDSTTSAAFMGEAAVKVMSGLYGIAKYDMFTPDNEHTSTKATRITIGAEWYPVNFVEIIPQVRFLTTEISSASVSMNEFLLQTHFWL